MAHAAVTPALHHRAGRQTELQGTYRATACQAKEFQLYCAHRHGHFQSHIPQRRYLHDGGSIETDRCVAGTYQTMGQGLPLEPAQEPLLGAMDPTIARY